MRKSSITSQLSELTALFPANTAGRDMVTDLPAFRETATVGEVRNHVLSEAKKYDSLNYIYVVDERSHILGVVSIREILQASAEKRLKNIMAKEIIAANPMDSVHQVALMALQHNLKMIPIVDHKDRLVGAFSSNQLLDILNRQFSDDLLRLSGIRVPKRHFSFNGMKIVSSRLPWMLIGMFGGLATGAIIGAFQNTVQTIVLLAVFIPVIMSTGATSANQSAMIFLRNLIHKDIAHPARYLLNELKVSGALGLILSTVLFVILSIIPGDMVLAMTVSLSLFVTIIAGSVIGVAIPMILNRLKLDPSTGAGPFLTILKDLLAMTIYFTIATVLLSLFR